MDSELQQKKSIHQLLPLESLLMLVHLHKIIQRQHDCDRFISPGSSFETSQNNGTAHFLEHMAFKGTQKRNRVQIEKEVEDIGASLNAYTTREQTVFYAKCLKNDVPKAVDILADILQNSKLDEANVEDERSTILREMEEVGKQEGEVIMDHLHSVAFQGSSLAYTILGPQENIKSITKNDLANYIKKHYVGNRLVLAAAGGVNHEQIVQLAKSTLGSLPAGSSPHLPTPPFTGSMVTVQDDTKPNTHIAIGLRGVGWSHPDHFGILLLQALTGSYDRNLGGGKAVSPKLIEIISEEKLAHRLTSYNTCYHDTGIFGVVAETSPEGEVVTELLYEVFNSYNTLAAGLTETELARAKAKVKAALLVHLDGTTAVCEDIGRQLQTLKKRRTTAEAFSIIDSITVSQLKAIIFKYCHDVDPAVAALGRLTEFPDYNFIRAWTAWKRL